MSITYYPLKILIPEPYDNMFEDVLKRLQAKFKNIIGAQVEMTGTDTIKITRDNWIYTLVWESDEEYLEELKGLAQVFFKDKPDQQQVFYSTKAYIEGWSTPDPNMDYFNDYVHVMEIFDQILNIFFFINHNSSAVENEFRPSDSTQSER